MNKKIISILIVMAFLVCSISIVSADNNTTDVVDNNTAEIEEAPEIDLPKYITALSFSANGVEFSDGYTGFPIDSAKNDVTSQDGFTTRPATSIDIGNYLKLAVIECYKQNSPNKLGDVIASFVNGAYSTSDDSIVKEVASSNENVLDHKVVEINNTTEATFDFELLDSVNDATSDYFAYKVSLKTIAGEDTLAATNDTNASVENATDVNKTDENQTSEDVNQTDDKNETLNQTDDDKNETLNQTDENKTSEDFNKTDENNTLNETNKTLEDNKTSEELNTTDENKTLAEVNKTEDNKTADDNNTLVQETNKTIVNKTNTLIVKQNNTTVVNQNNLKTINNTTKITPINDTVNSIARAAGNPIVLLVIVVVVVILAGLIYSRKD